MRSAAVLERRGRSGRLADPAVAVAAMLSLAGVVASFLAVGRIYVNHDVGWYLYAASHLDLGACRMYVDCFIETNPPLVLWISIAVVRAGMLLQLDPVASYHAFQIALAAGVGTLLYRGFRAAYPCSVAMPLSLAAGYVACANIMALADFGQRDQLIALLIGPYIALHASAAQQGRTDMLLRLASGMLAGIAVALKPHSVSIVLACEFWRLAHDRSWTASIRIETVGIVAVGCSYLAAVLLWAPGYLDLIEIVRTAYSAYAPPLADLLTVGRLIWVILPPAIAMALSFPLRLNNPVLPFAVAGVGGIASYFVQKIGFGYHALPAQILGTFAIFYTVLTRLSAVESNRAIGAAAAFCVAAMIGLKAILFAASPHVHSLPRFAQPGQTDPITWLVRALNRHGPGARVALADTSIAPFFPAVLYSGNTLADRFPTLWLLPALVREPQAASRQMARVRDVLFRSLREDLLRDPPALIVERRGILQAVSDPDFSPIAFLSTDRELASLFAQYEIADRYSFGRGTDLVIHARRQDEGGRQ